MGAAGGGRNPGRPEGAPVAPGTGTRVAAPFRCSDYVGPTGSTAVVGGRLYTGASAAQQLAAAAMLMSAGAAAVEQRGRS